MLEDVFIQKFNLKTTELEKNSQRLQTCIPKNIVFHT